MIDLPRNNLPVHYEVTVGYTRVRVMGMTQEDAIRQARRVLSIDMPRLYDVIRGLDSSRFQVVSLPSDTTHPLGDLT